MRLQKLIGISTVAILALNLILPMAATLGEEVEAAWTDPSGWYRTINGVLDTDKYTLYPFREESIKFGLSDFGELIDNNLNVGLEYAGERDPFAPVAGTNVPPELGKHVWINGWFIHITYNHSNPAWGLRNVWAGALFADTADYGGPWLRVDNNYGSCTYEWQEAFNLPGKEIDPNNPGDVVGDLKNGGRKTNGTVITDPLQVLYNGPRLWVAKITNHIYDWYEPSKINRHLVDLVITVIFNKVKKEVIVIKDVKLVPPAKFEVQPLNITVNDYTGEISVPVGYLVQLSNREEWDLGLLYTGTTSYSSYVHFYRGGEARDTAYNKDWTMLPTLPAKTKIKGYPDEVNRYGSQPGSVGKYDLAQIISNDKEYVGWHAFWPSVSDWSVTAGDDLTWYRAMWDDDPHTVDGLSEPWRSPLIVGEWDFMLSDQKRVLPGGVVANVQFRGVSVYGVTDLNDGEDLAFSTSNKVDSEVEYQLDEVFKPWDLLKAVHKETKRWVEWTTGSSITLKHKPFKYCEDWDKYCSFSERVYDYTEGKLLIRGKDYSLTYDRLTGKATISGLTSGHNYKILYSTEPEIEDVHQTFWHWASGDGCPFVIEIEDAWRDILGVSHGVYLKIVDGSLTTASSLTRGVHNITLSTIYLEKETNFKVFVGEVHEGRVKDLQDYTLEVTDDKEDNWTVTIELDKFKKNITCSNDPEVTWPLDSETVHVKYLRHKLDGYIIVNVTETEGDQVQGGPFEVLEAHLVLTTSYEEELGGRYEWTIVGKNAATVDSAGAALVTAAFKNKQVEIGLAGEDMYDTVIANQMPWVMRRFGAGYNREDYYYGGTDKRTALRDDWCKAGTVTGDEWPIASSNMIGVGGPIANLLAWYGNDFTQAFFALGEFTTYTPWSNRIVPLTCWDITKTRNYTSTNDVGYAVVATYKDINGTVLFLIWGHWGRDTYYVTKWFHEEGIYQLQEAPEGLTSMIVKITYENTGEGYKPKAYSIVECLGTISETEWRHGSETKGGIHDP